MNVQEVMLFHSVLAQSSSCSAELMTSKLSFHIDP